ncbi:hypothetical protein EDD85DRAFT_797420 [Armillaria nabsnona]|nr:hypothetical protein EDD85DRAFT_797420 [Armillaria nabsnona]
MADPYYLLRAILTKVPALWDAEVYDSLSNWQIAEQIEGAHTLLTTYWTAFDCPYPDFIERFFATASHAVHELPDRFINGHWNVWVYGPDLVKDFLKNGPFSTGDAHLLKVTAVTLTQPPPVKKCKDRKPSPPASSGQAGTSLVKTEKPARKRSKTASSAISKEGSSSAPLKKPSTKDKVKAELQPVKKESAATPAKPSMKPRGWKPIKPPLVEVPTLHHKKGVTPPPAVISEDTHTDPQGGYWLYYVHWSSSLVPAQRTAVLMHDHNFLAADRQIHHLLNALHEAYQLRTAVLCHLLQAFSQVKGAHDTDAFEKFAREYSTGHRLLINMGLIRDEDGVLQRITAPQLHHYYPRPLTVHSETTPEPQLPAFTVLPPDIRPVGGSESDEDSDSDRQDKATVVQDLEQDQLSLSSPVCPEPMTDPSLMNYGSSVWPDTVAECHAQKGPVYLLFLFSPAQNISYMSNLGWPGMVEQVGYKTLSLRFCSMFYLSFRMVCKAYSEPLALDTGIPPEQFKSLLVADHYILLRQACNRHPAVVDINTLATYLQPKIKSILDSVHPFLAAHESYFPKESNPTVIHFLATATALANNLSLAFQSSQWDAWKIEDPTRMFKLLGLSKPRFDPSDTFPGKAYAPSLLSLPLKQNRFQVASEHIFCQGLRWEHFQGAASDAWPEDLPLPFAWKDLPSLLQVDHYLLLHLARTQYPQVLNFDILVNSCQPDVANLINHVHPFLVAHVERFPDDEDPLVLRFLMTVTAVASNLGPCFFDQDWTLWLERDRRHLVIGFQATLYTSDLLFFQVGLGCYLWDLDKLPSAIADALQLLSRAGVYPIHLPAQLFSNFYIWPDMNIPAT